MKVNTVEVGAWSDGTVTVQLNDSIEELTREAAEELVAKLVWALESAKRVNGYAWEWVEDDVEPSSLKDIEDVPIPCFEEAAPAVNTYPTHAEWTYSGSTTPGCSAGSVAEPLIERTNGENAHWFLDELLGLRKTESKPIADSYFASREVDPRSE